MKREKSYYFQMQMDEICFSDLYESYWNSQLSDSSDPQVM